MPRFTRYAFADLAIWMGVVGLGTGVTFPVYVHFVNGGH
jgi:hypothetical protein